MKTILVLIATLNGMQIETPMRDYTADQAPSCIADMHAVRKAGFNAACIAASDIMPLWQPTACLMATVAPTDANLEACTGEPIDLSFGSRAKFVAYGCEGESAPIYGKDGDDFPVCDVIVRINDD